MAQQVSSTFNSRWWSEFLSDFKASLWADFIKSIIIAVIALFLQFVYHRVKGEDLPLHLTIIAGTYLIFLPLVVGWRAPPRSLLKVAKESHDQAERLRTQQQSHEIKLEILDVQAYPKLRAGKSKRIEGNLIVS
jgi:hypothetical protein